MKKTGLALVLVVLASTAVPPVAAAQPLFPEPFLLEHWIVQTGADGDVFTTEPVTDYYAGSRIVSVYADGNRRVVDFAERQLLEVRHEHQTYSVLTFDRFAELRRRLRHLQGSPEASAEETPAKARAAAEEAFRFEELPAVRRGARSEEEGLLGRAGVRRLRVTLEGRPPHAAAAQAAVEVWLDPRVRLGEAAQDALARFSDEVLGSAGDAVPFSRYVAAAGREARGAIPIRTVHPLSSAPGERGTFEDVALRLEPVASLPPELLSVPEGYRRTAHALEQMVAYAEEEARLQGRGGGTEPPG
jgi:hypothetical protein